MPPLENHRHELFAQALAKGKTQIEAYELAGYEPNDSHASRLVSNGKVRTRVSELLGRAADRVEISKAWVLGRLVDNVERSMQAQEIKNSNGGTGEYKYDGSVANRALELLGKELGMFIDRKESGAPGDFANLQSADEIIERVRREVGDHAADLLVGLMNHPDATHDAPDRVN